MQGGRDAADGVVDHGLAGIGGEAVAQKLGGGGGGDIHGDAADFMQRGLFGGGDAVQRHAFAALGGRLRIRGQFFCHSFRFRMGGGENLFGVRHGLRLAFFGIGQQGLGLGLQRCGLVQRGAHPGTAIVTQKVPVIQGESVRA